MIYQQFGDFLLHCDQYCVIITCRKQFKKLEQETIHNRVQNVCHQQKKCVSAKTHPLHNKSILKKLPKYKLTILILDKMTKSNLLKERTSKKDNGCKRTSNSSFLDLILCTVLQQGVAYYDLRIPCYMLHVTCYDLRIFRNVQEQKG